MRELSGVDEVQCICVQETHLAEGFNKALKKAIFPIVIFLRKEVRICSTDWGKRVVETFSSSTFGILGTLGTVVVPISGMLWEKEEPLCGSIWYQEYSNEGKNQFGGVFPGNVLEVVALEGSFLAVHKDRVKSLFDEAFKGDSFYEVDVCLQNYMQGVNIGVLFGIDVLKENFDEQDALFLNNYKKFIKKHTELPCRKIPKILFDEDKKVTIENEPSVHILIPNQGGVEDLIDCLEALYIKTNYKNYKVTIIDYGSTDDEIKEIQCYIGKNPKTEIKISQGCLLSQIYNEGAFHAQERLLLFLSKKVIFVNDAISLMVEEYIKNPYKVGTIGIRTHLKNHMVHQYGLQLISIETQEGVFELGLDFKGYGKAYGYKNETQRAVMGNSCECMLIERDLFFELSGFNVNYQYSLQDFELNLKAILLGRENIIVGGAVGIYSSYKRPKFHPVDYTLLMSFINDNIEGVTPYVYLLSA